MTNRPMRRPPALAANLAMQFQAPPPSPESVPGPGPEGGAKGKPEGPGARPATDETQETGGACASTTIMGSFSR
jgi:hypothetical protein